VTPASSSGVAERWRSVWTEARVLRPRAVRAARKAPGTLVRGMGVEARAMSSPPRPGAGQSHTGWRWVFQTWRSHSRVRCGRGTARS